MQVTFIGLGIMGSRMASHLLKNKVQLTVFNRSKEIVQSLEKQGAQAAKSVSEAVSQADIVFSMLSTPEVVKEVFLESDGGLSAMKKGATWVDCSTVNPSFSQVAHQHAQKYGIHFIDAPVAGTKPHADNAELAFFVGGAKKTIDMIKPYFAMMGKKTLHIGKVGQGASFKMLVNLMLAQSMVIFSEAVLLGSKMGLDKDFLLNALPGLVVSAPFTKFKAEMIRANNFGVQFPLEWMHKDLHLASLSAYEVGQPLHLANQAKELFAAAKQEGLGRLDFAAIHQFLDKKIQQ